MSTRGSLDQSMEKAVKHYASLFRLPSYKRVVLLQALVCMASGLSSVAILFRSSEKLVNGLLLGLALFSISLLSDYLASKFALRNDPIYDLRRTATLSLFCLGVWSLLIFLGVLVGLLFGVFWWLRLCLLGFSAVSILRLITLGASSSLNYRSILASSFLQSFFCLLPFLVFWIETGYSVTLGLFLFLILSPIVSLISTHVFLSLLDSLGEQTLGIPSLALLRAFLLNWITDSNTPFENLLEKLGEEHDVDVALVKFGTSKTKAAMVVPSIHPGPFKNVGSSPLPSLLKDSIEKRFDCTACIPLGLQGHELDLVSQLQNQKVISHIAEAMNFEVQQSQASPFVKVNSDSATASCQVFGDFALLSLTLAPNTTEDLPQELGLFVQEEARKLGLTCCVAINTHNSIDGPTDMSKALDSLKRVAKDCLGKAISMEKWTFEIGAATVRPEEFGLRDGMGTGGITAIIVKVNNQRTAYVVIDGNNMVTGLREKILSAFGSVNIDEGEIFTTDVHSVSATVLGKRGYNPIGQAMDHERLITYIKETTLIASRKLERANAACRCVTIPRVKVIGEKHLSALSLLIDRAFQRAKKTVIPIFFISGLLLMLFLTFI
ncbi:DUF2070 family protein [Candidatus Bathyarchaeota archaeon]|nr:DUF2070 family protein [Candidatus Bathyarchaeota archaeon]